MIVVVVVGLVAVVTVPNLVGTTTGANNVKQALGLFVPLGALPLLLVAIEVAQRRGRRSPEDRLDALLAPGERLVWCVRPRGAFWRGLGVGHRLHERAQAVAATVAVLGSAAGLQLVLLLVPSRKIGHDGELVLLLGLGSILVPIVVLIVRAALSVIGAGDDRYAVTDRRRVALLLGDEDGILPAAGVATTDAPAGAEVGRVVVGPWELDDVPDPHGAVATISRAPSGAE